MIQSLLLLTVLCHLILLTWTVPISYIQHCEEPQLCINQNNIGIMTFDTLGMNDHSASTESEWIQTSGLVES